MQTDQQPSSTEYYADNANEALLSAWQANIRKEAVKEFVKKLKYDYSYEGELKTESSKILWGDILTIAGLKQEDL